MKLKEEIWKPVPSREGFYEVSNLGRVRAVFAGNGGQFKVNRLLKPWVLNKKRYLMVSLDAPGMERVSRSVHSLVLEAFVGPRPKGAVSRHLDGIRTNNTPSNLTWGTSRENYDDSRKHQTNCEGERNGFAVLTADKVVKIRNLRGTGMTYKSLSALFGTHWSNVWLICKGRTWRQVPQFDAAS